MIRRPPRSTLFPSTPLSRSGTVRGFALGVQVQPQSRRPACTKETAQRAAFAEHGDFSMATIPITKRGAEKLKDELHRLKTVERPSIIQAIAEAREIGRASCRERV